MTTMDIDAPPPTQTAAKKQASPSASAESASPHPSMPLAQDIHRLAMIHAGKLDARAIAGLDSDRLLREVLTRVMGDQSVEEAVKDGQDAPAAAADDSRPLLNPFLHDHLASTLSDVAALSDSDRALLESQHKAALESLTSAIAKAAEESGDMEVLDAKLALARYCTKARSKNEAMEAYRQVVASPKLSTGKKLDGYLEMARVCSFWGDYNQMGQVLDTADKIIAKGGDWDRRNRLKAYRAIHHLLVRDLEQASKLFVDGIATFSCTELCDYPEFLTYAVVTSLLHLPRTDLKKCVIDGSEILAVANDIPVVIALANALYDCDYKQFLHTLVALQPHLIANRYLQPHSGFILRELHILAFRQFLDSYQSVTLQSMAASFGVSTHFLDTQLSRFIAAGRLTAKIDNVGGIVETNRPDWKNARYREMIQKGDLLLNRIQKLGRVVDL